MFILALSALVAHGPPGQLACTAPTGYESLVLSATVEAGQTFQRQFSDSLSFALIPIEYGWVIEVRAEGRDENLARLTPPWHFVPNPRYLEGWHFRNATNTAPNDGSVNAPQETREFYFSPEVGRSLDYEGSATSAAVVDSVRAFGTGELTLTRYTLTPFAANERASFREISFSLCLVWRAEPQPSRSRQDRARARSARQVRVVPGIHPPRVARR